MLRVMFTFNTEVEVTCFHSVSYSNNHQGLLCHNCDETNIAVLIKMDKYEADLVLENLLRNGFYNCSKFPTYYIDIVEEGV